MRSRMISSNQIYLDGFIICKEPIYRKTPLGREIADLLVAVNRPYGKSDYIPCICWGRNARSINYDKLDALLDYHCNNGTDCIVICGTTGESATMTEEEHMQCVKFAIDRVKGRIPVIAGTGSNCTRTAIGYV